MTTAAAQVQDHPYSVFRAEVGAVQRLSSNFVRITFVGDGLAGFGNPGATYDQRIKILFPPESGVLPDIDGGGGWYQSWLAVPEAERGSMRTYSVRDLRIGDDDATAVDIDFVLHMAPGATGPASSWAAAAAIGDEVLLVGPRRGRLDGGGVEFLPGAAEEILLAGDETAAPAIARILADASGELCGAAFIEVPESGDVLPIDAPDGVAVHWLPRDGAEHGARLRPAVLGHLGATADGIEAVDDGAPVAASADPIEELAWETPTFSRTGEEVVDDSSPAGDRYYWIAGESRVVTGIRRQLVKELGIPRAQVAFMGYWREGVAMKG